MSVGNTGDISTCLGFKPALGIAEVYFFQSLQAVASLDTSSTSVARVVETAGANIKKRGCSGDIATSSEKICFP